MTTLARSRRNTEIEKPRLLLVEGIDDYWFFHHIIEHRPHTDVQIIDLGGKNGLGDFLADVLVLDSRFPDIVKAVGVARDADDCYARAFQSVQDSLRRAGLPVPATPLAYGDGVVQNTEVRVITYIMPDNEAPGDLETLCLAAVKDCPAMTCVDQYFSCLQSIGHVPRQESKARLRAFLSANVANPNLLIGQAISAGVLPWDSAAFDGVHQFLNMLDAVV